MMTAEEAIKHKPSTLFLHALDMLSFILAKNPPSQTWFGKSPGASQLNGGKGPYYDELREGLEEPTPPDDGLDEVTEETYERVRRCREVPSDSGWLDIEAYLNREALCFEEPIRIQKHRAALTIVFDMAVPYQHRQDGYIESRAKRIYRHAVRAEAEGRPCRIIASYWACMDETCVKTYLVIKDWNDPIFSGIWGTLRDNRHSNALINTIACYFFGTRTKGNCYVRTMQIGEDIPEDEECVLIDPKYLTR